MPSFYGLTQLMAGGIQKRAAGSGLLGKVEYEAHDRKRDRQPSHTEVDGWNSENRRPPLRSTRTHVSHDQDDHG